jgi:pimeloyl-ACP methyl ester carboxylesterase
MLTTAGGLHRLGEITAPTLMIAGARDALYPPELAQPVAGGVREGKLEVTRGAGTTQ